MEILPTGRALLADLYELTMGQAYLDAGLAGRPATFSLTYRTLPEGWRYLVAAGLDDALAYLEELAFAEDDLTYLERTGIFRGDFLEHLRGLRFTGLVRALPEGTFVFPGEPLLEVTAPAVEAQLVESYLLNRIHLASLIASKAARCVEAAPGRTLVDFALRRAHGEDAALAVARSSYLAGFAATSNVLAGKRFGIPVAGTMAHSYVEAFADELESFRAFARSFPDGTTLLVDTYDTLGGARHAAQVGRELAAAGHHLRAVRLDSGDLAELAKGVRAILDEAGLPEVEIFASGNLDEHELAGLLAAGAPIGGFGVGSRMGTSADAPFLDMVYKLVEFDGRPVLKLSKGKATLPGAKQVWRVAGTRGRAHDVLGLAGEAGPEGGEPLLREVMRAGRRTFAETLEQARARCALERKKWTTLPLEVRTSGRLAALRDQVAAEALARLG
jgi:nicotinate phosphoribosyltransferase